MADRALQLGRHLAFLSWHWFGLVLSGAMGSLGLIGLIDRIFGWNGLETISTSFYSVIIRIVGWWDFLAIGATRWAADLSGLEVETNTVAASASILLVSTVGMKHFQFGLSDALAKKAKRVPGRKNANKVKQLKKEARYWFYQKLESVNAFFKSGAWVTALMITAYLVIVFAVNFSSSPVSPDTLKGMAYMVLLYSGYHATAQLIARDAYKRYLIVMLVSTLVLLGLSWHLQLQSVGIH